MSLYAPEFIPKITLMFVSYQPTRGLLEGTQYHYHFKETTEKHNSWITVTVTDLTFLAEDIGIHISIQKLHVAAPFMFIQRANECQCSTVKQNAKGKTFSA